VNNCYIPAMRKDRGGASKKSVRLH